MTGAQLAGTMIQLPLRQFMQADSYHEGVEPHNDPDRLGINQFLDDDEPPGRPLL